MSAVGESGADGPLSITVLGCSGTYAAVDGACSGYLVRGRGTTVWVDTGPGTLANVQRHTTFADIDAVVVSHCHPDHWTELPVLRNVFKYVVHRAGVPVHGTAETLAMAEAATHDGLAPTFDWHLIEDHATADIGALRFSFSRTDHPVETLAVRIEDTTTGEAIAYSSDTGPGWSVSAFGADVDLFVCEATLTTDEEGLAPHISAREAGAMAAAAGVRRLVLTHHWPGGDVEAQRAAAEATFGRPVELATINERFTL